MAYSPTTWVAPGADGRRLFVLGDDGALWHMWQTAPKNGWSQWVSPMHAVRSRGRPKCSAASAVTWDVAMKRYLRHGDIVGAAPTMPGPIPPHDPHPLPFTPDPKLGESSLQDIGSSCDVARDNTAQVLL
jgi:hypothetical protein